MYAILCVVGSFVCCLLWRHNAPSQYRVWLTHAHLIDTGYLERSGSGNRVFQCRRHYSLTTIKFSRLLPMLCARVEHKNILSMMSINQLLLMWCNEINPEFLRQNRFQYLLLTMCMTVCIGAILVLFVRCLLWRHDEHLFLSWFRWRQESRRRRGREHRLPVPRWLRSWQAAAAVVSDAATSVDASRGHFPSN